MSDWQKKVGGSVNAKDDEFWRLCSTYGTDEKDMKGECPLQIVTDKQQLGNVEYFIYINSITNDAGGTREIKSRISIVTATFTSKKGFHKQIGLKFKQETSEMQHLDKSILRWNLDTSESRSER